MTPQKVSYHFSQRCEWLDPAGLPRARPCCCAQPASELGALLTWDAPGEWVPSPTWSALGLPPQPGSVRILTEGRQQVQALKRLQLKNSKDVTSTTPVRVRAKGETQASRGWGEQNNHFVAEVGNAVAIKQYTRDHLCRHKLFAFLQREKYAHSHPGTPKAHTNNDTWLEVQDLMTSV